MTPAEFLARLEAIDPGEDPEAFSNALRAIERAYLEADRQSAIVLRSRAMACLKKLGFSAKDAQQLLADLNRPDTTDAGHRVAGGRTLAFEAVSPWPDAVDGQALLTELQNVVRQYVICTEEQCLAISLWIIHTWCLDFADITPRLAILSPEMRCGKSQLLAVIAALCKRPLFVSSLTPAALFRSIEKYAPTVLADEFDNAEVAKKSNGDLRVKFNSGWSREGAAVIRCEVDTFEPKEFSTWAPLAVALIGELTGPLRDRSIVITMRRKRMTEVVERVPHGRLKALHRRQRQMICKWVQDHSSALADSSPESPEVLDDRATENWRPLLAIAEAIDPSVAERARQAAVVLEQARAEDSQSVRTKLLSAIQKITMDWNEDRISTQELIERLKDMEGEPWGDWNEGRGISPSQVAKHLRPFGLKPCSQRHGVKTFKGYWIAPFDEVFERYLSGEQAETEQLEGPDGLDVPAVPANGEGGE